MHKISKIWPVHPIHWEKKSRKKFFSHNVKFSPKFRFFSKCVFFLKSDVCSKFLSLKMKKKTCVKILDSNGIWTQDPTTLCRHKTMSMNTLTTTPRAYTHRWAHHLDISSLMYVTHIPKYNNRTNSNMLKYDIFTKY